MDETWSLWSSLTDMHYMHWKLKRLENFLTPLNELVATGNGKWSIGTMLTSQHPRMEKMGRASGIPFLQEDHFNCFNTWVSEQFQCISTQIFSWGLENNYIFFHSIRHWHQGEIYEASLEKMRSWGWQWHSGNMFGIATNFRDSSI